MKKSVIMKAIVSQGTGTWDDSKEIGTLKSNLDKSDILSLSNKNIDGDATHVVLFVKANANAVPTMLFCTKPLSKIVRKAIANKKSHKEVLRFLLDLKLANLMIEGDNGEEEQTFIIAPGKQGESYSTAEILKEAVMTYEDILNVL